MKKEINRTLGNSLRCILPSFWWKRLLGKMVDKIESVEATAKSATQKVSSISGELRELTNDITSLSTDVDRKLSNKQDTLYSGNNIKTINGKSILGYGDIQIGDIQIEDYIKTVTSKEALDDLEVRAGTIATVVSVDTSESATELSMSTCYKIPAEKYGDYSFYNKLTPIRKVAIHVPSVNNSGRHWIELIKGNSNDGKLYIIYDNGRVGYNIGTSVIRDLLVSDGQLIQSNIDALNDLLNSNDYRYYSTGASGGFDSWSDVEACRDSWVKRISLVSDSYIKEEDWIRLLKEGDVTGGGSSVDVDTELSNTSTNPVQNKVITETISAIDARVDDIEDFLEQGSNLTLTIKSNQSSDATISAVKASIKYENKTVESGSGIIGLPAFTTITITFPNVEGYKTPEPITFDTNGHPTSYTAIYETELVNINLSAWDASSVSGQVITINGKDYTWSDTTISHKVAFGTEYWVYANDKNGYTTKGEKFIASQVSRDVEIVYNAMEGSFITIDQNIADPTTRVSGDIGGEHIQLIRNNSHRYLGKYTADGTMTVCQLDDEDSNYYSDGSSALLDGSQGDVFMKLPKFFYTVHERRPDVYSIGFYYGDNAPSNEWVEWRGDELIGVFKTNENARSAAVRSSYGLSKDDYSERAAARGNGYSLIKWKHNGIIAALYFAFYGNTNSQEVIGIGLEAGNRNCGSTASLGMSDTSASEEAINLWGLENWWGAGYEFFENVIYYYDTHIWKITEDDGAVREREATRNGSFLGKCYIDFHLDFGIERSDSNGSYSATTGYCDDYSHYTSGVKERPVLRGNLGTSQTGLLGMFTDHSSSDSVIGNYFGGSRICFKGTILTNNDSTAFKALTPIN